jgi:hypothetical protein
MLDRQRNSEVTKRIRQCEAFRFLELTASRLREAMSGS